MRRKSPIDCNTMQNWRTLSVDILISGRKGAERGEGEQNRIGHLRDIGIRVDMCTYDMCMHYDPVWVHVNLGNACVCIEVYISISRKGVTTALLYSILNQFFRAHRSSLCFLKVTNTMPRKSVIASR